MAKSTKNTYKPTKKGNLIPVVRMADGGNVSELNYSDRKAYIESHYAPFITDAQMIFSIYDSGIEYNYKGDRKEVVNSIIESYKSLADYTQITLPQETIYEIKDWELVRKDIDPDTDDVIGETPLKELSADNTYNFSYNGLVDLNWRVYEDEEYERYFYVITPHLGGDIRGNYGDAFILQGNDKDELFYRYYEGFISGGASIYFKFKDGSEIGFDSEQDSDVFYFRLNEIFEPTGMAKKYLKDFEKFETWYGDEFLEETIDIYLMRKGEAPKMMAGGSLNDETPMAYIQVLGYNEGQWFNLTDYSDGQDVIDGIYDWMNGLNTQFGGNREEYEVTDYEGFGNDLYDQYMSSNEFDEIIEGYEKYENSDFHSDIITAYRNDSGSGSNSLSDVIDEMDNNFFGKYESLQDFGYEMVQQGVYEPSDYDVYITDTDKRILAGEEADAVVDGMDFDELLNIAEGVKSEYESEISDLENKISDITTEIDELTSLQDDIENADDEEYEIISDQIEEKEVELDDIQNELDNIDSSFEDRAREEARDTFYDEIYDKLENDLSSWLEEYGYTENLQDISFLSVDYEKIGDEIGADYLIIEYDGQMYFFSNYAKGGRLMATKQKPKYDYYIVESSTKKLVSGYSTKKEALEQRKLLIEEYPSMRFEIYTLGNLESKTDLDVFSKKDYVQLSTLDKIKKVSVDAFRYGKEKVGQANEFLVRNDVKGKIKRGARNVADKTKQGFNWLRNKWNEADFGDGKGKAKFFANGGGVEIGRTFESENDSLNTFKGYNNYFCIEFNGKVLHSVKTKSQHLKKLNELVDKYNLTEIKQKNSEFDDGGMVNKIIGIAKTHPYSNFQETYAYPTSEKVPPKFFNDLGITLENQDDYVLVLEIQFDTKKIILQGYYANYNGSGETENYDDVYSYHINQLSVEFEKWLVSSLLEEIKRIKDSIRLNKIDELIKELEKKSGKTKKECQEIIEKFKQIEETKYADGGEIKLSKKQKDEIKEHIADYYYNNELIDNYEEWEMDYMLEDKNGRIILKSGYAENDVMKKIIIYFELNNFSDIDLIDKEIQLYGDTILSDNYGDNDYDSVQDWQKNNFADGGGVGKIKLKDEVFWKGNEYTLSKITDDRIGGMIDKKYHLYSYKVGVPNVILDSLKDVKKKMAYDIFIDKKSFDNGGGVDKPLLKKLFEGNYENNLKESVLVIDNGNGTFQFYDEILGFNGDIKKTKQQAIRNLESYISKNYKVVNKFADGGGLETFWGGIRGKLRIPMLSFEKVDYNVNVERKGTNNYEIDVNITKNDSVDSRKLYDVAEEVSQENWGYLIQVVSFEQLYETLKVLRVRVSKNKLFSWFNGKRYDEGGSLFEDNFESEYNSMSKNDKEELMRETIGVGRTPFSEYEKYNQLSDYHKELVDNYFTRDYKKMADGGRLDKKNNEYWEKRENLEMFLNLNDEDIYWKWVNGELTDLMAVELIREIHGVDFDATKKYVDGGGVSTPKYYLTLKKGLTITNELYQDTFKTGIQYSDWGITAEQYKKLKNGDTINIKGSNVSWDWQFKVTKDMVERIREIKTNDVEFANGGRIENAEMPTRERTTITRPTTTPTTTPSKPDKDNPYNPKIKPRPKASKYNFN